MKTFKVLFMGFAVALLLLLSGPVADAANPCNPCAKKNPCAAKNPCNPCAKK